MRGVDEDGERAVRVVNEDVAAGRVRPQVAGGLASSGTSAEVLDRPAGADRADTEPLPVGRSTGRRR
ncbi:hypothetical protein FHR33_008406 [Nonomuraea dietziae]|uniref:Uncharacterized protein n=1 Tax=Nonomuraea dietziae TaxID=65515 RepID=A0A7W5YCL1_9ACTN|nr:hypothetical protein [Nonomuraea dietziae]